MTALSGSLHRLERASEVASTPLDFNKPLWHVYLVDNYNGGSALLIRLHHCIADGIALVMVLLSLTDLSAKRSMYIDESKAEPAVPPRASRRSCWSSPKLSSAAC